MLPSSHGPTCDQAAIDCSQIAGAVRIVSAGRSRPARNSGEADWRAEPRASGAWKNRSGNVCSRGVERKRHKSWRRGSESNRRIKVLQTSPLPLGYRARWTVTPQTSAFDALPFALAKEDEKRLMERETGFEPATSTLARSHSTTELLPLRG